MVEVLSYALNIFFLIFLLLSVYREYKLFFISPNLLFQAFQCLMFLGVLLLADFKDDRDIYLCFLYIIGNSAFFIGNEISYRINRGVHKKVDISKLSRLSNYIFIAVSLASIIACSVFFYSTGNIFINSIANLITGESITNYSELRKSINYTPGSGYIYVIRVYILPFIVFYMVNYGEGACKIIGKFLIFPTFLFLVSTGQRAGVVEAMIMMCISQIMHAHYLKQKDFINKKRMYKYFVYVFIAFVILTVANNRAGEGLLNGLYVRFIHDNQYSDLMTFRYLIFDSSCVWGEDWFGTLFSVLPGAKHYIGISSMGHEYIYSTITGTAPPGIWGSAYYNFRLLGVLFLGLFLGFSFKCLFFRMYYKKLTSYRIHLFSYLFYSVGSWIADGPVHLINCGFVILLLLHMVVNKLRGSGFYEKSINLICSR